VDSVFQPVIYAQLNARQKEVHNYQVLSGLLARLGFHTHNIPDDWLGADFIARHMVTGEHLLVQLKPRLFFQRRYEGKGLWIGFVEGASGYVYPHDEVLNSVLEIDATLRRHVDDNGGLHWAGVPKWIKPFLVRYRLT
jgi:hypothetical protein